MVKITLTIPSEWGLKAQEIYHSLVATAFVDIAQTDISLIEDAEAMARSIFLFMSQP